MFPKSEFTREVIPGPQTAYNIAMQLRRAIRDPDTTRYAKWVAPKLRGNSNYESCFNVYKFLRGKMIYKAEPSSLQSARTLKRILLDAQAKKGDCKHYTTFACSVLKEMGIPVKMRLISQNILKRDPTHIYCVAIVNGREVIVDPCIKSFDREAINFYKYNLNI